MEVNNSKNIRNVSFQGYQHKKTETGAQAYEFNCIYDSSKYDCEIEFFNVTKDRKNNYHIEKDCDNQLTPIYTVQVQKGGATVEPKYDLNLNDEEPFAYRYILKDKKTGNIVHIQKEDSSYEANNGGLTQKSLNQDNEGCTIVTRKGTTVTKQGPMYLAIPDTFAPGYVYRGFNEKNTGELVTPTEEEKQQIAEKIHKSNRTFSNTMGGTIAGLQAKLPELRQAGFKRIITTPIKGGDKVSSHKYWNENNMLMAGNIGNINNYSSLQREAFKNGMNLVDDGTFTSEGLQGIHFQRAIKWMNKDDKPAEYYYFRMSGLQDGSLGLGVVPENMKNLSHKLVNSPFDYTFSNGQYKAVENKDYDPKQPTILQIFDSSLVSDEQKNDKTKIITKYAKTNTDNKLAMNTHDDTPMPYSFEINPYEYKKNIENLNEVNNTRATKDLIQKDSPQGTMFVGSLSGISIEKKTEGGFVCWDANTDMAKLNYFASNYDTELVSEEKDPAKRAIELDKIRRGNYNVQDLAISAGKYWTKYVRNIHNEYVAQTIGKISSNPEEAYNTITDILNKQNPDNPILPEDVRISQKVVENVLDNNYELRPKTSDYNELVLSSLMDYPLDAIEFAPDTQGALSSPYLMKRASDSEHVGQSRYDAMNDDTYKIPEEYKKTYTKMNNIYTEEMKKFADAVITKINNTSEEKLILDDKVTEYGQYIIPLIAEDIAKYAIVKSLMPEAKSKLLDNGEITYDYETMSEKGSLRNLGINGDSQEDEANQITNKIRYGLHNLKEEDVNFIASSALKRFKNTNANSFKLAEVMVDRSGLGLDWRLDAAKDIADMDSVRNADQSFDTGWNNVIKFWGAFVNAVKKENPNSYTVAEITDTNELIQAGRPDNNDMVYDSENKAIGSLIDLAGITSEANYSYFFNGISNMFGFDFASGRDMVGNKDSERVNKLEDSLNRFISQPIDYKRNSYTFASNHDKPRMIHCLSMNMNLYHSDLTNPANYDNRKIAYMIINNIMDPKEISDAGNKIIESDRTYFNNVSAQAVANGELLRRSIGQVNENLKNAEIEKISASNINDEDKKQKCDEIDKKYSTIYTALSTALADVVNGKYYKTDDDIHNLSTPDTYKKSLEKEGFGSKPIPDAFDIVYDQAIEKYDLKDLLNGEDLNEYKKNVDSKATEVGRTKTRIIMRFLNALSGNPTVFSGDELGMTGIETKCQNTSLQNRNANDWSMIEDTGKNRRPDIIDYRNKLSNITRTRIDDDNNIMEALNNGTMYKLNPQNGYKNGTSEALRVSAVISQASNGSMNISVLNPNGISTDNNIDIKYIKPNDVWLDSIYLAGPDGKMSMDVGTVFKNVNPEDDAIYKVCNNGDDYYIKRIVNGKEDGILLDSKTAPDGVFSLYHVPDEVLAQRDELIKTKSKAREYYNPQYNIPNPATYSSSSSEQGGNLDITSKD